MGKYEIKTYEDGYEVEQARIGSEIAANYLAPHQTNAEQLKERYSQEDFDPETRLYAFKDDKMIGFITTRIMPDEVDGKKIATLTPPQVLPDYDDEVSELLFEKAINVLKSKGAQRIRSVFGCNQNKSEEDAKKWDYELANRSYFLYEIDVESIDNTQIESQVTTVDFSKHSDALVKIFSEEYGIEEERAKAFVDRIANRQDDNRDVKYLVIEEDNDLKGLAFIGSNPLNPKIYGVSPLVAKDPKYMEQFLAELAKIKKKNKSIRFQCAFTEEKDVTFDKYKPVKFKLIGTSAFYERDI